jgi:hypothetical protein
LVHVFRPDFNHRLNQPRQYRFQLSRTNREFPVDSRDAPTRWRPRMSKAYLKESKIKHKFMMQILFHPFDHNNLQIMPYFMHTAVR